MNLHKARKGMEVDKVTQIAPGHEKRRRAKILGTGACGIHVEYLDNGTDEWLPVNKVKVAQGGVVRVEPRDEETAEADQDDEETGTDMGHDDKARDQKTAHGTETQALPTDGPISISDLVARGINPFQLWIGLGREMKDYAAERVLTEEKAVEAAQNEIDYAQSLLAEATSRKSAAQDRLRQATSERDAIQSRVGSL